MIAQKKAQHTLMSIRPHSFDWNKPMRPPRLAWSAVALAALPLLHGAAELDARSLFEPAFGRGAAPPRHALAEAAAPLAGARYVGVWSMAGSNNRREALATAARSPRTSPFILFPHSGCPIRVE